MAVADRDANGAFSLTVRDLRTGSSRRLTNPAAIEGDRFPAFSPDGTRLAFIRTSALGASDLYIIDSRGGEARRVTHEEVWMAGVTWISNEQLIVSDNRAGSFRLSRIALRDGASRPMPDASDDCVRPSAGDGYLAWERQRFDSDIVRESTTANDAPRRWMSSTREDREPSVSFDGTAIAFVSARSGRPQLWLARSDGQLRRLTSLQATTVMTPRWSRDGKRIAFTALVGKDIGVYTIGVDSLELRRLTHGDSIDLSPSFGADSDTLYCTSNRGGRWGVWRRDRSGEHRVLDVPAGTVREIEDGSLIFNRMDVAGLFRLPPNGTIPLLLTNRLGKGEWGGWTIAGRRVYFVERTPAGGRLLSMDIGGGAPVALRSFASDFDSQGLSVTPDGSTIYFTLRDTSESDIAVVALDATRR